MPTNFPTGLDSFSNPTSTTQLNGGGNAALSHSTLHANVQDAIRAIQEFLGINNSSDPNSVQYKLNSLLQNMTSSSILGVQSPTPVSRLTRYGYLNGYSAGSTVTNGAYAHPDNDGKSLVINASTSVGTISVYSATNALVRTCDATLMFPKVSSYLPGGTLQSDTFFNIRSFWIDTVDQAVWFMVRLDVNTDFSGTIAQQTKGYILMKWNYVDGTLTSFGPLITTGNGQQIFGYVSLNVSSYNSSAFNISMERSSMGSGNFEIWGHNIQTSGSATLGDNYKMVISPTGSVVTALSRPTSGGVNVMGNFQYHTKDKAICIGFTRNATTGDTQLSIMRNGVFATANVDLTPIGCTSSSVIIWGDLVVFGFNRYFDRTDFDAWLVSIADALGLPA